MEEIIFSKFKNYAQNFDFSNDMISRKFYHTFRVVNYAKDIAQSENLNEHDYNLAIICALLHDIGRFKQATTYKTYEDLKSVDHGNLGYEILFENDYISEYVTNTYDKEIVLKAVKNHNKFIIDESLNDKELFFAKLTRDADKLDILDKQQNEINDNINVIDEKSISFIKENKLFKRDGNVKNNATDIVNTITFIFDINFKSTFEIIKEKKIIERKIDVLRKHCDANLVNEIENEINKYLNSK